MYTKHSRRVMITFIFLLIISSLSDWINFNHYSNWCFPRKHFSRRKFKLKKIDGKTGIELRMIDASRRDLLDAWWEVRSGPISCDTDVPPSNHKQTSASHKVGGKVGGWGDSAGKNSTILYLWLEFSGEWRFHCWKCVILKEPTMAFSIKFRDGMTFVLVVGTEISARLWAYVCCHCTESAGRNQIS